MASATAKSRPQKRRVQPQQVLVTPTSPVVTPGRKAVLVHDKLKEQAAIAERCLDPGRRVYVDIPADGIVNYRKVLVQVVKCAKCCCEKAMLHVVCAHCTTRPPSPRFFAMLVSILAPNTRLVSHQDPHGYDAHQFVCVQNMQHAL